MQVLVYEDDSSSAEHEARLALNSGRVIVFPTDTVYGLLASVQHPGAYRRIYTIKQRQPDQPIQLLISPDQPVSTEIKAALSGQPEFAREFAGGRLTLILPVTSVPSLPSPVSRTQAGDVGFRLPGDQRLQSLLARVGGLVWGTSANQSGQPSCRSQQDITGWISGCSDQPDLTVLSRLDCLGPVSRIARLSSSGLDYLR